MQSLITILRRDPRDFNARHDGLDAVHCSGGDVVWCEELRRDCGIWRGQRGGVGRDPICRHGAPSHDSFSRVFRLLGPDEMARAFMAFAAALREGLGLKPAQGVVAMDGKRLRRGYERGKAHMPPLMVSVWDAETRLSLAAGASADGNEVKATLAALKTVVLKGVIVTADALHCHPAMAEAVRERGGDYGKLKANHAPLFACTTRAFARADAGGKLAVWEQRNTGHDRSEWRRASVIAAPADAAAFPGLKALGRIESQRVCTGGKTSSAVHYIALSRRLSKIARTPARSRPPPRLERGKPPSPAARCRLLHEDGTLREAERTTPRLISA